MTRRTNKGGGGQLELALGHPPPAMPPRTRAPYVKDSETSREAAESVEPHLNEMEKKVLDRIVGSFAYGRTSDEIEEATGMRHQTVSARLVALEEKGIIVRTRNKRRTRSGRRAFVYVARQYAADNKEQS